MLIVGIDTGKTIGFAIYDTETKLMKLSEESDINTIKSKLFEEWPRVIVFEKIVNYGLGIDEAVLRAALEIGYLACVANDILAECIYYTKRAWSGTLFAPDKKAGIKSKKITDTMIKNKIKDIYNITDVGSHSIQAAGLIYKYLNDKENRTT